MLANPDGQEYNPAVSKLQLWRTPVPVSKKRKKNNSSSSRRPGTPPVAKVELAKKKKPMSRQQIGIIVISVLVILSMAVGFLVSGSRRSQPVPQTSNTTVQETVAPTAAPAEEKSPADAPADESAPAEDAADN